MYVLQRPPQSKAELYELVRTLWGVTIPWTPVCPQHSTPFDAFADAFFATAPVSVWKASRGLGGKSRTLAYLVLTEAVVLGADANILGGSGAQSQNVHEAMRAGWNHPLAPRQMLITDSMTEMRLTGEVKVRALLASQRSVRGPHPQRLRLDEIDEMDLAILDAAMGQPMPSETVDSQVVLSSTHQYPDKCVVGGTLVWTRRGEIPVEEVEAGDEVMTRKGWRRVESKMMSGYRPVVRMTLSNGRILTCTDDHRVAVPGPIGWTIPKWMSLGEEVVGIDPNFALAQPRGWVRRLASACSATSGLDANSDSLAGLALSAALGVDPGVGRRVFVALRAVGLPGVDCRGSGPAPDVLGAGDGLQMSGVHTGSVPAQVVDGEVADRADEADVGPAMGPAVEVGVLDPSVSLAHGALPDPAAVVVDDAPSQEPVFVVDSHIVRVLQPVYDLEVEDQHEFVAEGVVVHNTMSEILQRAGQQGWPTHEWCYRESSNDVDGWLRNEQIKRTRAMVTSQMWQVEYDLQEPAVGNRAIDTDAVEAMFAGYRAEPDTPPDDDPGMAVYKHHDPERGERYVFETPDLKKGEYVTGADWAKEQDWTVIATFRTDCEPWRLVAFSRTHRRPYPLMVKLFNSHLDRFPGAAIHDATGLGNVVGDYLDARVKGFVMTGRQRDDMLTEYINAVEDHRLVAPKIESAYTEHKYASVEDVYKRGETTHLPDTVCALALCWHMRDRMVKDVVPALDLEHEGGSPWRID